MVYDIENGDIPLDGVVVLTMDRSGGEWILDTYRAGVHQSEEIALCELGKDRCIRNWIVHHGDCDYDD